MKKEWVLDRIEVECYAGYRGQELPRAFAYLGRRYEILEIMDRWYEGKMDPTAPRRDYFKVRTTEGDIFLLRYTSQDDSWMLCRKVPSPRFSNN
ncbi:MAG: DUF6504 family protein [Thermodesulfobacteriota bacterium]